MSSSNIYLKELKAYFWQIGAISALLAVATFLLLSQAAPSHIVHFSYIVSLSEREPTPEYRFDGFYALQATDLFTATLAKWVATPEVIVAAHSEADLELKVNDQRSLAKLVKAEKTAPQLVSVAVLGKTPEEAQTLAQGLQQVMAKNIELYNDEGIPALAFKVVTTNYWISEQALGVGPISAAVFVFTVIILVNLVILKTALEEK